MSHRALRFASAVLLWAASLVVSPTRAGDLLQDQIRRARDKVYPALINIQVDAEEYSGGRPARMRAGGSGVIVSPEGFALTNHHVAGDARRMVCAISSGEEIAADLVGTDPQTDISVIRLRLEERKPGAPPLSFASLGDSDALSVGDYVLAMGNPLFQSNSVSLGIVSNFYGNLPSICRETGLSDYFKVVIDSGRVGFQKPDANIFLAALNELGTSPDRSVFVGDSMKRDMRGAKELGMRHIWVVGKNYRNDPPCCPGDLVVSSVMELEKILL